MIIQKFNFYCEFLCIIFIFDCVLCKSFSRKTFSQFQGSGPLANERMGFIDTRCNTLEPESLAEIMGPAFNPRYMSVIQPPEQLQEIDNNEDNFKRKASEYNQFFVDGDYAHELGDKPAWEIDHFRSADLSMEIREDGRVKRSPPASRPWECQAIIKWMDLGADYFPRYLRTVECTKQDCWYGKYTCIPKSFTVKLLRRKKGKCVYHHERKEGVVGLPKELRELWVWEERAVNFCCDCAAP